MSFVADVCDVETGVKQVWSRCRGRASFSFFCLFFCFFLVMDCVGTYQLDLMHYLKSRAVTGQNV